MCFVIAPRLNAVGRLDDANPLIDFLLTEDKTRAIVVASQLEGINAQRKFLSDQVFAGAQAQIEANLSLLDHSILILSHPQWSAGVLGIVASRLVEMFQRPVILLNSPPGQTARGSARSIEGINITAAISENKSLLLGFGGHPMAAGLSLPEKNIPAFQRAINRTVERLQQESHITHELHLDARLPWEKIDLDLAEQLISLAPFGPGNPAPVFYSTNLSIVSSASLGKTGEHLLITVEDENGISHRVVYWQGGGIPLPNDLFDLAYTVRSSSYRGQVDLQLDWVAARQVEVETIQVTQPSPIMVEDLRRLPDPIAWLDKSSDAVNAVIWREGIGKRTPPGVDRYHLKPAQTLIILSIPPGPEELASAVAACQAERVILLAFQSGQDHIQPFLETLTGLIHHAIQKHNGKATIQELAAATAQREIVVWYGVQWLITAGYIRINSLQDNPLIIYEGGVPDHKQKLLIETNLNRLLAEVRSYREYYLRAPARQLIP